MVTLERGVACDISLGVILFVDCGWRQMRLAPVLGAPQECSFAVPYALGGWALNEVDWWRAEAHILRCDGGWLALYRLENWSSLIEHALSAPAREDRLALP